MLWLEIIAYTAQDRGGNGAKIGRPGVALLSWREPIHQNRSKPSVEFAHNSNGISCTESEVQVGVQVDSNARARVIFCPQTTPPLAWPLPASRFLLDRKRPEPLTLRSRAIGWRSVSPCPCYTPYGNPLDPRPPSRYPCRRKVNGTTGKPESSRSCRTSFSRHVSVAFPTWTALRPRSSPTSATRRPAVNSSPRSAIIL